MLHTKRAALVAVAVLAAASVGAEVPETVDPAEIPSYRVLQPGLAAAGRPSPAALEKLKDWGFKTVIDLRAVGEEGVAAEKEALKALGLRYVSVPVSPATFRGEDVDVVAKLVADAEAGPVLLHCSTANRVGAVWAVMQVQRGKRLEEAEAEGVKAGLKSSAMIEAVKRVVQELPKPVEPK